MRILIVGAGAVGGYFGARLHEAGHTTRFVARGPHAAQLATAGLQIESDEGQRCVGPFDVSTLQGAAGFEAEVALVAVKAASLADVASELAACLAPKGYVVPLLNGLDSERILAGHVGNERVLSAVAYLSASLTGPGCLRLSGFARAGLAPYGRDSDPRVAELAGVLDAAGIPTMQHSDAPKMLWQKMLWNVPFNAVCALTDRAAGGVLESDELTDLVRACMREVLAVARAEGAELPETSIEAMLAVTRAQLARTLPSMLQDVRAARVTEVDVLQDAVVQRGESAGVPTPVTRTLAALVRAKHPSS